MKKTTQHTGRHEKGAVVMTFLETVTALIVLRCEGYLEETTGQGGLGKYPSLRLFVSRLSDEALKQWARTEDTADKPDKEETDFGQIIENDAEIRTIQVKRYKAVLKMLGGSRIMQSFLDLELALFSFPEFGAYLTENFGYSVNLHLACLLEGVLFPSAEEMQSMYTLAKKLCHTDPAASPRQYAELVLDERAMGFMFGSDELNPVICGFTTMFDPAGEGDELHDAFVHTKLVEEGIDFFRNGGKVLQLTGKGGRRFLAKHIAKGLSRCFLFLNIADFFREAGKDRMEELKGALIREAVFDNAGICLYGITDDFLLGGDEENRRLQRDLEVLERVLLKPVWREGIPLILCTDSGRALIRTISPGEYLLAELPAETDYESRCRLWSGFASIYGLSLDAERLAMRYRLNASEISAMIRAYIERRPSKKGEKNEPEETGAGQESLFARLCIQRAEAEDGKNVGRVVYPDLRLEDVKVKPQIRSILNDAVDGIRTSPKVLDTWGLRKNYPYGRCVSILLSGPPGTGKTMTANAVAGELSLPLYQINLSNIMDKYIGETEKNLEKAFRFAEKTDSVLFFDEADALFGARSEVHDAKDRYANTEISYLLQRIEAYDGVVIMATNIMGNIDPAFLRRIRYVVRYDNPDESLRREIWEGCLTEGLPHGEIDLDYLAKQFDTFTGSMIKTVFLNACAGAAGRDEILGMPHLIHAIRQELEKTQTVGFKGDTLGKYSYLA